MKKATIIILVFLVGLITNCGLNKGNPKNQLIENHKVICDSCWATNYSKIAQDILNINKMDLEKFFACCCKECSNNAEFSEFSNGLLYRLLQENTDLTIKVLSETKNLDLNYIDFMLENPIDDGIDLNLTIKKIESVEGNPDLKNRLLKSIKTAIGKG